MLAQVLQVPLYQLLFSTNDPCESSSPNHDISSVLSGTFEIEFRRIDMEASDRASKAFVVQAVLSD